MVANKYQACIDACEKCAQTCYECFEACINEPDLNTRRNCVKMLIECARICETSAALMSMNGMLAIEQCKMCADICDSCEKECRLYQDEHCQKCADVCRICASECRRMIDMQ
ncbi:hypothetical protein CLORY_37430 [Clostridium oryzae]|uniref:Cysteine-rich protein YhjQ n=2 Tax=Clostridium oryzae TaxID=1450648 RepID=A0A1V4IE37_9CLOT|nr:hypothetical protein CLORY_37430 [Clostridium oryzae]